MSAVFAAPGWENTHDKHDRCHRYKNEKAFSEIILKNGKNFHDGTLLSGHHARAYD
jgi:hypothetical protein